MSVGTTENLVFNKATAAEFLVNGRGNPILLTGISWDEYEMFLDDFAEKSGWKLTYDKGKLEIMPPLMEHEEASRTIDMLVRAYSEQFDLNLQAVGSTTFRRKLKEKGIEPDDCFYIENSSRIIGKSKFLSPHEYPMPDIAVEVDVTHGSLDKFPIYASLEIPEVWIFDGESIIFYQLEKDNYKEILYSRALPQLSAKKLTEFLEISQQKGQMTALKTFRLFLSELIPE